MPPKPHLIAWSCWIVLQGFSGSINGWYACWGGGVVFSTGISFVKQDGNITVNTWPVDSCANCFIWNASDVESVAEKNNDVDIFSVGLVLDMRLRRPPLCGTFATRCFLYDDTWVHVQAYGLWCNRLHQCLPPPSHPNFGLDQLGIVCLHFHVA